MGTPRQLTVALHAGWNSAPRVNHGERAFVFYIRFLSAELRRRPGRTALTALGLAVGVGLVVIVGALSKGLDDAQDEVLEPLTGVGTDLSVSRPLDVSGGDDPAAGSSSPTPACPASMCESPGWQW